MAANLAAIDVLHRLRSETRPATGDEQTVLAAWSSWGAVPGVFDESNTEWADARERLRGLLDEREWAAAARTTINAHYTDPRVAREMWRLAGNLGLSAGDMIEPGCGAGTLIGLAPAGVHVTGVELDPTTAAIAAALYPDATVRAESFADSRFPTAGFDAAIGNVPFGDVVLHDRVHNPHGLAMHNHFLCKAVDLVRPGGIAVMLTSAFTLDAVNPAARREIFARADLLGAVRLPTGSARRTAGTDALMDLLVLRRRLPDEQRGDETWLRTYPQTIDGVPRRINRYLIAHPEMVLGVPHVGAGMYGSDTLTVTGDLDALPALLRDAADKIASRAVAAGLTVTPRGDRPVVPVAVAPDLSGAIGTVTGSPADGFTRLTAAGPEPIDVPTTQRRELAALLALGEGAHRLLRMEAASIDDTPALDTARRALAAGYERYRSTYGPIGRYTAVTTSRIDPDTGDPVTQRRRPPVMRYLCTHPLAALIRAVEAFDDATGAAAPAALLTGRVVVPRTPPLGVDTADEAVSVAMDTDGTVTLARVASLLGVDQGEARAALGELVYDDPVTGVIVPAAEYLSGNVRDKLDAAQAAVAAGRDDLSVNVTALCAVLPRDLGPAEITARVGAVWIEQGDYQQFLRELIDSGRVTVTWGGGTSWEVSATGWSLAATSRWGTQRRPAGELLESMLCQRPIAVYDTTDDGSRVFNPGESEAAKEKAEAIQERFAEWVWEDPARADRLAAEYNRRFNSLVLRDYSREGTRLTLPGLAADRVPRPHQRAAVARMICEPAVGLFHEVGAGKTGEMVMGAMELRRLHLAAKPVVVVPNHMLEQFSREWLQWYPRAKVLAAGSDDLAGENRRDFVARAATGDWDGIVMTRSAFQRLAVSVDAQRDYQQREVAELRAQIALAKGNGAFRTVKQVEKILLRREEELKAKLGQPRDAGISFEDTGIDYVIADEGHAYKNLMTASAIPGAGIDGSARAADLHMKLDLLRRRNGSRVVTLATATPIANSITEAHVMLRYLRPDLLEAAGVGPFDAWAATFGKTVTELELSPTGRYREKTRFASFTNVPELLRMWHVAGDVKTGDDLHLPTPALAVRPDGQRAPETVIVPPSPALLAYMAELGRRADALGSGRPGPGEDNMLRITGDGRRAALDLRLVGHPEPGVPQKLDVAADRIAAIWRECAGRGYVDATGEVSPVRGALQLVFCDQSTPKADTWNAYDTLKSLLVDRGVPAGSVRFIHDAARDEDKARLFAACRSGQVAVLIGSTEKMGVGTNVQDRAIALHHIDCPWRPADLAQRDGRILRQGNQNDEVTIVRYTTGRSFDAYSWQTVQRKATFISQVLAGRLADRDVDDIGDTALSLAETKALAADDPLILRKATADAALAKLTRLEKAHHRELSMLSYRAKEAAAAIARADVDEPALVAAVARLVDTRGELFHATIDGRHYRERTDAVLALRDALFSQPYYLRGTARPVAVSLAGHDFTLTRNDATTLAITIAGVPRAGFVATTAGFADGVGGIRTLENHAAKIPTLLQELRAGRQARALEGQAAREGLARPFPHAERLAAARRAAEDVARLIEERAHPPRAEPSGGDGGHGVPGGDGAANSGDGAQTPPTATEPAHPASPGVTTFAAHGPVVAATDGHSATGTGPGGGWQRRTPAWRAAQQQSGSGPLTATRER